MNVTNLTPNPMLLPGSELPLLPGATVKVDNWKDIKDHPFVALLLEQKLLTTGGDVAEAPEPDAAEAAPAATRARRS